MSRGRDTVEKAIARLPVGGRFLLAVSGGVDSMTLLDAAAEVAAKRRLTLEVAHVDHAVRAKSRADAAFVRKEAARRKLRFHLIRLRRCPRGTNFESWARDRRYEFFGSIVKKRKLGAVVTAHTANDVAETLLMRLVSNRELRSIAREDSARKVLRPFLSVPRSEIEGYARAKKLSWRDDETNEDLAFLRNKVRKRLIPLIEREFDRQAVLSLSERAFAIEDDLSFIESLVLPAVGRISAAGPWGGKAWLRRLREEARDQPAALRARMLEMLAKKKLGFKIGHRAAERLWAFLLRDSARIELPGGFSLVRRGGGLSVQHDRLRSGLPAPSKRAAARRRGKLC